MAFSLFGKKEPAAAKGSAGGAGPKDDRGVRPMTRADIPAVLSIINEHDEDDAEEAADGFEKSLSGMFVAYDEDCIVGVTGAIEDAEANGVCWLSWTYVEESQRRQGMGRYLVDGLLHELKSSGIRKLFMATGDYIEDGEDIYAPAKAFYRSLGARLELKIDDYFDVGEARYVFGLDIVDRGNPTPASQDGHLIFNGIYGIAECEQGVSLAWREFDGDNDDIDPGKLLQLQIDAARKEQNRFMIAAIPADLSVGAVKGLEQAGFEPLGALEDYYRPGISQLFWLLRLNGTVLESES